MISVAYASLLEALRKKIFLFVGIITIIYLGLFSFIVYKVVGEIKSLNNSTGNMMVIASQVVSILGFYFSSMITAFLTIMSSVGSISSEIENGTIHSIITKPIKRMEYILGKYLGLAVLVTAYSVFLYLSVLVICAVFELPILKSIGYENSLRGMLFFIVEPLAILSLSVFGGTFFKTMGNGIFVISVYILGMIGGMFEQIGGVILNQNLINTGILASLLSPFDVIYRQMISTVFSGVGISNPMMIGVKGVEKVPSMWMNFYIGIYLVGLIVLAVVRFNKKDIS